MSHFVCLVIGDDWEEQLRPFCEHSNDEESPDHMEFSDQTAEIQADWETGGQLDWFADCALREDEFEEPVRDPNNEDIWSITTTDAFTNVFRISGRKAGDKIKLYRGEGEDKEELYGQIIKIDEPSKEKRKITFSFIAAPETVLFKDKYKSIEEFAQGYHGYRQHDGLWGYFHNPRAKWDWYVLGGRWGGHLKLKKVKLLPGDIAEILENGFTLGEIQTLVKLIQANRNKFYETVGSYGEKSQQVLRCIMRYAMATYPSGFKHGDLDVFTQMDIDKGKVTREEVIMDRIGYCDQTIKKYIDVEGMEKPKRKWAEKTWDKFHSEGYADFMKDVPRPSGKTPFRLAYEKFPEKMKKWANKNLGLMHGYDEFNRLATMSREEYVECVGAWTPFALLWEGKWYESGEMGWWGISTNHEPQWKGNFRELWAQIPDGELISVVDCHI